MTRHADEQTNQPADDAARRRRLLGIVLAAVGIFVVLGLLVLMSLMES